MNLSWSSEIRNSQVWVESTVERQCSAANISTCSTMTCFTSHVQVCARKAELTDGLLLTLKSLAKAGWRGTFRTSCQFMESVRRFLSTKFGAVTPVCSSSMCPVQSSPGTLFYLRVLLCQRQYAANFQHVNWEINNGLTRQNTWDCYLLHILCVCYMRQRLCGFSQMLTDE